jgi:hypothetical protein
MLTYRHTDRQTDMTKLVVAFRNVANAPIIRAVSDMTSTCYSVEL